MSTLAELASLCKGEVVVHINPHRGAYQNIFEYMSSLDRFIEEEVPAAIRQGCLESGTLVEVFAYPDTSVGFYRIVHWDVDMAIQEALGAVRGDRCH